MDMKATLEYLLSQGFETEVLEFKTAENSYDFRKLGKYFSALSNEANLLGKEDAWLVFGVKDSDKSIVGSQYRNDAAKLQNLKAEIANKTTHRITFKDIYEVNTSAGRVVLFQIPPAPKGIPVAWEGHYYGRDGEELNALNIEEQERIRNQRWEDDWSIGICEEALNNCIAHQDYTLGGKINVIENEDSMLVFSNMGSFIPQTVEHVITADAPEPQYRNRFLANAMVNLNMIDTVGSGIKRMFTIQKNKFFPLPEYTLSNEQVKVVVTGKVVDINYARKLAQMSDLGLEEIMLLDKVQKHKLLTDAELKRLRQKKLVEGRRPNFHISSHVARQTGQKGDYIKMRGIDDEYCQKIIVDYLREFFEGKKSDFEKVLLDKLPDVLDEQQKKNKVKNNLQVLRKRGVISNEGKTWKMSKADS